MRIGLKNRIVLEIRGKHIRCLTEERKTAFGSSYQEVQKPEGLRNQDSSVTTSFFRGEQK